MNKLIISTAFIAILVGLATCQHDAKASMKKPIVLKYKSNATFDCSSMKAPEFYRSINGTETKYEGNEKKVQIENGKLTLFDIRGEDINADYLCREKEDHSKKIEFLKKIAPYLYKPEKQSQTVSEGNRVDFKCSLLYGHPDNRFEHIEWEWHKNGTLLKEVPDRLSISKNDNESVLSFFKVVDADKGNYECIVRNIYGEHTEFLQLRVKDALAALWPFLAIVAEVLILCVILLVYEKKCSKKPNAAEDENEQTQNLMGRDGNADLKKRTVKA